MSAKKRAKIQPKVELNTQTPEATKATIWKRLPVWLRYACVIVPIAGGAVTTIYSSWEWINKNYFSVPPERFIFSCSILNNNNSIVTKIRLVGEKERVIDEESTDTDGHVVFNIQKQDKVMLIQYLSYEKWKDIVIEDERLKKSQIVTINLESNQIEFQ